jgi:hypothetical protein
MPKKEAPLACPALQQGKTLIACAAGGPLPGQKGGSR